MTSPMLTPEALSAMSRARTASTAMAAVAYAFLAAQDRDALTEIIHEAIDPSREFWWTGDAARNAVDALLGKEKS